MQTFDSILIKWIHFISIDLQRNLCTLKQTKSLKLIFQKEEEEEKKFSSVCCKLMSVQWSTIGINNIPQTIN